MSVLSNLLNGGSGTVLNIVIVSMVVLILASLLWNIILSVKLSKLNRKYRKFMRGTSGKNFEAMLLEQVETIEDAVGRVNLVNGELLELKNQTDRCIQKCSIVRYNAFSDTGSDLSFSVALLDNFNDGFMLTGIYGRNESITYAKPIDKGVSKYPLSVEEEMALNRSLKKNVK